MKQNEQNDASTFNLVSKLRSRNNNTVVIRPPCFVVAKARAAPTAFPFLSKAKNNSNFSIKSNGRAVFVAAKNNQGTFCVHGPR